MQGPPPKPKDAPTDLAEVERAISVLHGRHPDHERVRREAEQARVERQVRLDEQSRREHAQSLQRRVLIGTVGVVTVAVVFVIGSGVRREFARRARLDQAGDPYRAMGFGVVDASSRSNPGQLEVASAEPGCYVAVATEPLPVRVTRGEGRSVEGPGPAFFCSCQQERITASSAVGEGGGVVLLRIDGAMVGGTRAVAFLPFKPGVVGRSDEACEETQFSHWIDAKRWPRTTPDDKWLAEPSRARMKALGFRSLGTVAPDKPLAVIEVPAASCMMAASSRSGDQVSISLRPNGMPIPSGAGVGWCSTAEGVVAVVERKGTGEVAVVAAPAGPLGGGAGLAEIASESGVALGPVALAPADRAWSARQMLLASEIPEVLISEASAPDVPSAPDARVIALSFGTPSALTPDPPAEVFSYCEPSLDANTRDALCIFSGPTPWRAGGVDAVAGIARAKLPFWLFVMQPVSEPVALKLETQLIGLARRLKRDGFEPTTLEAVTELPTGVEILGRVDEDAVIAVGLAPTAPWVFPYTDGPAWTLDGAPRIVPIKPLEKITLKGPRPIPAKETRRSVIFRRHAR